MDRTLDGLFGADPGAGVRRREVYLLPLGRTSMGRGKLPALATGEERPTVGVANFGSRTRDFALRSSAEPGGPVGGEVALRSPAPMHTKSLKVFCDVVERRSFSRAADENGISQSSASQLVQALERRLGVTLLDRSTRPFSLTPEGERFYDGCRDLVRRMEQLEEEVRTLHDAEARSLVVASIYSVGLHHMSAFMQRFSAEHPRAQVRLEYLHPHRVCEVVERGDADLGIVSYPKETDALAVVPWRSEPMAIVCHPQHRLAREQATPLKAIAGEPFVAFESGLAIREAIDRALVRAHAEVNVALEFDNIETMKRAIEIDAGVSILPEPSVRREIALGTLASVAIVGDAVVRPLGILHRQDRQLSELAQQFIGLLKADAEFSADLATVNGAQKGFGTAESA